jgi:hypothetical protein
MGRAKTILIALAAMGMAAALAATGARQTEGAAAAKAESTAAIESTDSQARAQETTPVFHIQLWDAQKTDWRGDALDDLAADGFTIVQNGWDKSLFPSRSVLDQVSRHGLLYGAYINTRYMFSKEATPGERDKAHYAVEAGGKASKSELNTFDPIYQEVVRRGIAKGIKSIQGSKGLYKIMLNSEHGAPISYDELTQAKAVEAGVMKEGQKMPLYDRGVSKTPEDKDCADPYRFLRWFDNEGGDRAVNRVAVEAIQRADVGIHTTTDPVADGYTYGQYRTMDILQDWIRVHRAPRDPLSIVYRVERMKAHIRHDAPAWKKSGTVRQIWIGPQLGTSTDQEHYAAPGDVLQEAMWLAVAFGARGLTFWGYDSVLRSETLDRNAWLGIGRFKETLLSEGGRGILEAEDAPRACAVLLSKANQVYSGRKYYDTDDNYENFYRVVLTANVQADVIYDDDVLEGRLESYRALLLPGIEHLTPELEKEIAAFEKAGGRVVRWPRLDPSYSDYEITKGHVKEDVDVDEPGNQFLLPHQYRAWRQRQAEKLFGKVGDLQDVRLDSTDVIMNVVVIGGRRRAVLINDRRTYGEWTEKRGFRWSEDKGLPAEATVIVGRGEAERRIAVRLPAASAAVVPIW